MSSNIDDMAALRRLGGGEEGPRDDVIHVRMRSDERADIKAMATEDGWEESSWLYLRVQELIRAEKRKRRRRVQD